MAPNESNGQRSVIVTWIPFGAVILTILFAMFASSKDTPSRDEMKSEDVRLEMRITARMDRIDAKLDRVLFMLEEKR